MAKHTKRREPQLRFTKTRDIGWHANYRDPVTNVARKKRFGMLPEEEARSAYRIWLVEHMDGIKLTSAEPELAPPLARKKTKPDHTGDKLIVIGSSLITYEEGRARKNGEPRRAGTISPRVALDRKKSVYQFLAYLNEHHGDGAVSRMTLGDLTMADVEGYNRSLAEAGYSASIVSKRLQVVRGLINRAGRPEHGGQVLSWNWDARDVVHGKPTKEKRLPKLPILKKILAACDERGRAMVWMGIGLGFGQSDLAAVRVGQIDERGYDLRRGKTGIQRFGVTPSGVWKAIEAYLKLKSREEGALMFTTRNGLPLVHDRSDAVFQWWDELRNSIGEDKDSLDGFYMLRHLGATEFGSRSGCSISDIKRWLGHSASSAVADVYMKPVAPEHRKLIEWVRGRLLRP